MKLIQKQQKSLLILIAKERIKVLLKTFLYFFLARNS